MRFPASGPSLLAMPVVVTRQAGVAPRLVMRDSRAASWPAAKSTVLTLNRKRFGPPLSEDEGAALGWMAQPPRSSVRSRLGSSRGWGPHAMGLLAHGIA